MNGIWFDISSIVAIISTIISIYEIIKIVVERSVIAYIPIIGKCFSWRQINYMVLKVCKKIKESSEDFGSIVGIGRGGAIFASLMSYQLDAIPLFAFDRKYLINNSNKTVVSVVDDIVLHERFKYLLNKPILLVSQRADPGITIKEYKQRLQKIGFKKVIVCAILVSENNSFVDIPYYYKKYNFNTRTKYFPWIYKKPNIMTDRKHMLDKTL